MQRIVLHADVDSFFCQVEALRNPELQGKPLAVQQHQDIIAVNHAARAAGVIKHMNPSEARSLLSACGGQVVHVFTEEGLRVSYRPYREVSQALMRLFKRFVNAAVVQKASIDEAFILCHPPGQGPGSGITHDIGLGLQLAGAIRSAAREELGLVVSVGISSNKMLAKLASRLAKPDGMHVLHSAREVAAVLAATPVDKLPGMGGRVAESLARGGVHKAADLQHFTAQQLASEFGIRPATAAVLAEYGQGQDSSEVQDKGPPKSIQVQMTLTPVPLPMPPGMVGKESAAGGQGGMLQPLPVGAADCRSRLSRLLRAMAGDLLGRVMLDKHLEGRWPGKLSLQLITHGPQGRTTSQSCAFPSAALADKAAAAVFGGPGATGAPPSSAAAVVPGSSSSSLLMGERLFEPNASLLDAVCGVADNLSQAMLPLHTSGAPLVQVHLSSSCFGALAAASSAPITRFFQAVRPAARTNTEVQQQQQDRLNQQQQEMQGQKTREAALHMEDWSGAVLNNPTAAQASTATVIAGQEEAVGASGRVASHGQNKATCDVAMRDDVDQARGSGAAGVPMQMPGASDVVVGKVRLQQGLKRARGEGAVAVHGEGGTSVMHARRHDSLPAVGVGPAGQVRMQVGREHMAAAPAAPLDILDLITSLPCGASASDRAHFEQLSSAFESRLLQLGLRPVCRGSDGS